MGSSSRLIGCVNNDKMKKPSSTKSWATIAVIVAVAAIAYFAFFAGAPDASDQSLLQSSPEGAEVGVQVLGLLNQIESLKIDDSFFAGAVYNSLQDYSVAIPPLPVGRDNPFAPI